MLLSALSLVLAIGSAQAADKTVDDFKASITLSPLHLVMPLVEVTGEFKLADRVGLAVIGGAGRVEDYPVWEAGAQGRFYALGSFRGGLELGAELLALGVSVEEGGVTGTGVGLAMGPFVGGKYITDIGFTIDGQLGGSVVFASAQATDGTSTESQGSRTLTPLLNLNLGWSF
jgi:hypothetical protein